ncbi:hypothetical protein NMG60_11005905 [Bertholletia excelsa]
MKLVNLGHAQSEETRMKIGVGVRMGWERRREKLRLQETCYFKWQNLIAEASRRGFVGEEELQWDSYMSLDEQLEKEWLESVEQRKEMAKAKGNRRAPKSLEQRRKISESISAKWADPAYRDRVCSGLAKYFGMPVGAERKPKRRTSGERQPRTQSATKKVAKDTCKSLGNGAKSHSSRGRRRHMPMFNPLASSQLEMIKNIRAQRAAAENKTTEAIEQAKLLIAEAEKAAKALETAAMRSPLARNSLIETRKLIAEALQSIRSIDTGQNDSYGVESNPNYQSLAHGVESNPNYHNLSQKDREEVNGIQTVDLGEINVGDFGFGKLNFQDYVNSKGEVLVNGKESKEALYQTGKDYRGFVSMDFGSVVKQQSFIGQLSQFETDGINSQDKKLLINGSGLSAFRSRREKEEAPPDSTTRTKKWVRGKLVEMVEGE